MAESPYSLGEIVVSGETPRIVESVGSVDVVTADDIQRSGARNLDEAIRLLPGLYVRTGGDGTPRIDIRGLRTRQVILLLDGVPINSAIDGQFDPSAIDVANIERIKVTRGTSSLLYGSGGTAGVINIITKAGARNFNASVLAEFGENGHRRGQITAGGGMEDWKAFVSASGFHRDNFDLSDDYDPVTVTGAPTPNNFQPAGERINSDRTDKNLYANFLWQGLPRTELGISGSYRDGYFGKPGEVRDFTGGDADPFARRPRFEREDDFEGFSLNLTGKHEFLVPLTVRPMLYFNRLDELTNNYDNANFNTQGVNRSFRQDIRSDIYGGDIQINYDFDQYGYSSFAFNCRHESWHDSGFQRIALDALEPININVDDDICATALEHEIHFMDRIGLVGSAGYSWQDRSSDNKEDGVNYLLGAYYDPVTNVRVHISHSSQVRFPTLRDLYEPGRANPDLKPERTKQYEAGIEYTFTQVPANISFTIFRTDAENFIEVPPAGGGMVQNIEQNRFEGIEISGSVLLFDSLDLRAAYTLLESINLSSGVTNNDLQNRPHDQFSVEVNYHIPWVGIDINASLLHIAGSLELSRTLPVTSRETGDYDVVNFKAEKRYGNAGLFARVTNLFDEDYVESGGFPAPGRSIMVGGDLNFGL